MDSQAPSVSSATRALTSAATYASAKRRARARSSAAPGLGGRPWSASSRSRFIAARARCRVPLTAVWLVLSMLATSPLAKPSTSQHQRGRLARRHALQAGDEGQLDRLARLVAGMGAGRDVGDAFQQLVR